MSHENDNLPGGLEPHAEHELELLCSRSFSVDPADRLSVPEQDRLNQAVARDADLAELMQLLSRAHSAVSLAAEHKLPADFKARVLAGLDTAEPELAPVYKLRFAAAPLLVAAALVLTLGLVFIVSAVNQIGRPAGDGFGVAAKPDPEVKPDTPVLPTAQIYVSSSESFTVRDGANRQRTETSMDAQVSLPAEVQAPANAHTVIKVGNGTAVLSPGSRARLSDVDADGTPNFEPVEGDLYLETRGGQVRSRIGTVDLRLSRGGVTLRRTEGGYTAMPSHGGTSVGGRNVALRQCAFVGEDGVRLDACDANGLDEWAVSGRVDAIKHEVRKLLGARFDQIGAERWQGWEKMLRGVLTRPSESASHAYSIRFLLKYGFFEDAGADENAAWTRIADILGEGTSEADIPVPMLEMFHAFEKELEQNPGLMDQLRQMLRQSLERMAERQK